MYPTGCPLRGPGHDISVGALMYLTVSDLLGPGSIPGDGRINQAFFLPDHTHLERR